MNRRMRYLTGSLVFLAAVTYGCAGGQVTKGFNDRSGVIAAKIAEAERLGAVRCAPRELARAMVELDHARHEAAEHYYPREWLNTEFDKAEAAADELLARQRLAVTAGARFRCAERGGRAIPVSSRNP